MAECYSEQKNRVTAKSPSKFFVASQTNCRLFGLKFEPNRRCSSVNCALNRSKQVWLLREGHEKRRISKERCGSLRLCSYSQVSKFASAKFVHIPQKFSRSLAATIVGSPKSNPSLTSRDLPEKRVRPKFLSLTVQSLHFIANRALRSAHAFRKIYLIRTRCGRSLRYNSS